MRVEMLALYVPCPYHANCRAVGQGEGRVTWACGSTLPIDGPTVQRLLRAVPAGQRRERR